MGGHQLAPVEGWSLLMEALRDRRGSASLTPPPHPQE